MKRMLLILCTLVLIFGMVGSASALSFTEEYTGYQSVYEGQAFDFGFDFWEANLIGTNSSLNLTQDAAGAFDPWQSASLGLGLYSTDSDYETVRIVLRAYNSWGGTSDYFNLGTFTANLNSGHYNFTYNFSQSQLEAFEEYGWGNVRIRAAFDGDIFNYNDFGITRVAMRVNTLDSTAPVPEPSTILLMGAGLLGLVAVGRRKFNRKD